MARAVGQQVLRVDAQPSDDVLEGMVDIEEGLSRYTDKQVAAMREELITMILRFLYRTPS